MALSPLPFHDRPGIAALVEALGVGASRFVGGCVRDALLGVPVADIDMATLHRPDEVMRRLRGAGIKAIPTGIAHGTVTAVSASTVVEVTTLRRDVSTNGRHAIVEFAEEWRDDAARRDFTMNALYAHPDSGAISDWFGGLADLAAGRVRFIGDPLQRIAEDHLRILRFFRFHARFGDLVDGEGLAACVERASSLMALSRERIAAELLKLLIARAAVPVTALMVEHGILTPVLPEIDEEGIARLTALAEAEATAGVAPDAIRRLAALVPAADAEAIGARLKLSNARRKRLAAATAGPGDEGPKALGYRIGIESAIDRLLLAGADPTVLTDWTPPRLPVSGGDLVIRGLAKGPAVAAALRAIETRWIDEGFPDAARTAEIADEVVAQALASDAATADQASSASNGRA